MNKLYFKTMANIMIMIMTKLLNVRTVAKAMGGRISGQRGVRGLASEKKVRIGVCFFWLYFSRKVLHINFVRMCKGKLFRMFKWVLGGHTHRSASALGRGKDPVFGQFPK